MNFTRQGIIASCLIHAAVLLLLGTLQMRMSPPSATVQYIRIVFAQEVARFLPPRAATPPAKESRQIAPARVQIKEESSSAKRSDPIEEAHNVSIISALPVKQAETAATAAAKTEHAVTFGPSDTSITGGVFGKGDRAGETEASPAAKIVPGPSGAPAFLHRELPVYPVLARRMGKEGRVVLKLLIDRNGKLQQVDVVESAPYGFTEAAMEAAWRSTYLPAQHNGVYVPTLAILPVRFKLE